MWNPSCEFAPALVSRTSPADAPGRLRSSVTTRVLVLSASIGTGHVMAAAALESAFRARSDVDVVLNLDVLQGTNEAFRSFYDDAYFALVRATPWLVGWGYDLNDAPFKLGSSVSIWDRINTSATVRAIERFKPTHVVCTHFLPMRLISLLLTRGTVDCTLSAVTTDYDFQGLWLTGVFTRYFVAREETRDYLVATGLPEDRVTVSGIPVRAGLGEVIDREGVLRRYGLRDDLPTLLISAGAAGGDYVLSIVHQVKRLRTPCQTIVVCGHNAGLRRTIEAAVGEAEHFVVLGYTDDMINLMGAATLFVGKPGGLSSSECMAVGLPMVLINPIPGQEVRNSDFLLEEGAALRCNYETTVGFKVDRLLSQPEKLAAMAAAARRIGHVDAAQQIATDVLAETTRQLWISHAAQRSILRSSELGLGQADVEGPDRLVTLLDSSTGLAAAVILASEVDVVEGVADASTNRGARVYVSRERLSRLRRRRRNDPGMLLLLRRIVDGRPDVGLTVKP